MIMALYWMSSAGLNLPLWPRAGYILTDGNGWKPFSNDHAAATGTERKEGEGKYSQPARINTICVTPGVHRGVVDNPGSLLTK